MKDFIVFYLIISSGVEIIGENESIIVGLFFILLIIAHILKFKKLRFSKKNFPVLIFILVIMFISTIVNKDPFSSSNSLNFILGNALKIINAFLVINYLDFETFSQKFVKQVYYLSLVSLIFYFTFFIFPSLANIIPSIPKEGRSYDFLLYIHTPIRIFPFPRNSSFFYEPGVFQGLLIVSLLLLRANRTKFDPVFKYYTVFFTALITTFSTTGYLGLILFLLLYIQNKKNKLIAFVSLLLLLLLLPSIRVFREVVSQKLLDPYSNNSSGRRFTDVIIETKMFLEKPFFGYGYEYFEQKGIRLQKVPNIQMWAGSTNSITYHLAFYGLLFMLPIFYGIFKLSVRINSKNKFSIFLTFVIILVLLMGETFLQKMLFLVICLYSFSSREGYYLKQKI